MACNSPSSSASSYCSLPSELVKANLHGNQVLHNLNVLRQHGELCDFTVIVDEQTFPVHKAILSATSDYFRAMFAGKMIESREDQVTLKGMSSSAISQIIDFMYTGELNLGFENLSEILNAASHLQVLLAVDLCCSYMKSKLTFDNAEDLLQIAHIYSLDNFIEHLDNMIMDQFEDFCQTDMFLELEPERLLKFLSSNSMKIQSEFVLFQYVLRYLQSSASECQTMRLTNEKIKSQMAHAAMRIKLFNLIRFPLMSEDQLSQTKANPMHIAEQTEKQVEQLTVGYHPDLNKLVVEGIKFGLDCRIGHPLINERTDVRSNEESMVLIHKNMNFLPLQVIAFNSANKQFYRLFSSTSGSSDYRISVIDNFLYIACIVDMGGGSLMNSLCRFDPRHLTMQELRPMKKLRLDSSMVAHSKKLYVMGGTSEHLTLMNSMEVYDVITNAWTDGQHIPLKSHSHATCTVNGVIYLSGGVTSLNGYPVPDLFSFKPSDGKWLTKARMKNARRLHDMVPIGKNIYILGGIPKHGLHHTPNTGIAIESYNIETNQWTQMSVTLNGRSVGHFVSLDGQIYSVGHEHSQSAEDEIWVYDIKTETWSKHMKAPHNMSFASAMCTLLHVNFRDANVADKKVKNRKLSVLLRTGSCV